MTEKVHSIFVFVLLLFGCANPSISPEKRAKDLVNASISAHGGRSAYEQLKDLSYIKTTYTYHSLEQVSDTLVQLINHNRLGHIRLTYQNDQGLNEIEEKDEQLSVRLNGEVQYDTTLIKNAKSTLDGAQFVFFQPFKLKDSLVRLKVLGRRTLFHKENQLSEEVEVVEATYPNSSDIWYFFFDPETDRLLANAVNHNGKMSLIINDSLQWHKGMLVHRFRTSYLSNDQFEPIRVQARYDYEMLTLN